MEALTGAVLAAVAKAIAGKIGGELAGSALQGVKKRAFGDPERKALERALQRAYDRVVVGHGRVLADYDVNPGFLQFEAAGELAKALVPGVQPSASRLAELCVASLGPQPDDDVRWAGMVALRPGLASADLEVTPVDTPRSACVTSRSAEIGRGSGCAISGGGAGGMVP
jgi:hypothetical protein